VKWAARDQQLSVSGGRDPLVREASGVFLFFHRMPGGRRVTVISLPADLLFDLDQRIATHEAGHCVAACLLGMPPAGATIDEVGAYRGLTWFDDDADPRADPPAGTVAIVAELQPLMPKLGRNRDAVAADLMRCADHVIVSLAGIEAERLITGAAMASTGHDLQEARALASLIVRSPAAVDTYLTYARAEARALLAEHANAVQAIASALVEHRTLNAGQIGKIMQAGTFPTAF
jgi:hypothetical protein